MNTKIKPTKEQLILLKAMINENKPYTAMGIAIGRSAKTAKRIIEDHHLDMSNYDPTKQPHPRIFVPTKTQLVFIQESLDAGKGKIYVCKALGINRNALNPIIARYNIDMSKYKRPGGREVKLSVKKQKELQKMLDNKVKYVDIAKVLNVNRNLIKDLISKYGLSTNQQRCSDNRNFSDKQIELIRSMAKDRLTIPKMALCMRCSQKCIKDIISEYDIDWQDTTDKMKTDLLVEYAAKSIELETDFVSDRNWLSAEEIRILPSLLQKHYFENICELLNKNPKAVKHAVWICGLNEMLSYDYILTYDYCDQFKHDMLNPALTHTTLSKKYGMCVESARTWRNEYFGNPETRIDVFMNKSSAELDFEEILKTLDLAFFYQKEIARYKVDYYLGQRLVVEIQGDYWHRLNTENRCQQDTDNKKKIDLENNGYVVLQIWENEIRHNKTTVANKVITAYLNQLQRNK